MDDAAPTGTDGAIGGVEEAADGRRPVGRRHGAAGRDHVEGTGGDAGLFGEGQAGVDGGHGGVSCSRGLRNRNTQTGMAWVFAFDGGGMVYLLQYLSLKTMIF